jgi:hypothetical protein
MRSLITLIARRATGVSANRRKFTAVGFGNAELIAGPREPDPPVRPPPAGQNIGESEENGARFDPVPAVRRVARPLAPANTARVARAPASAIRASAARAPAPDNARPPASNPSVNFATAFLTASG